MSVKVKNTYKQNLILATGYEPNYDFEFKDVSKIWNLPLS